MLVFTAERARRGTRTVFVVLAPFGTAMHSDHRVSANDSTSGERARRRVLTFGLDNHEWAVLQRLASSHTSDMVQATSVAALIRALSTATAADQLVVMDTSDLSKHELHEVRDTIAQLGSDLVCRIALTKRTALQFAELAQAGASPTASLRGFDRLEDAVSTAAFERRVRDATGVIVSRLCNEISADGLGFGVSAALVGRQACSVDKWATLMTESRRSLERHLAEHSLPRPRRLLGWMLALHALWRVQHLNWPTKRAALEAGLPSAHSLTSRIGRLLDFDGSGPIRSQEFAEVAELFARDLQRHRTSASRDYP